MKKIIGIFVGLFSITTLFFSEKANAQCEGTCIPEIICKSIYFNDQKSPVPCPIVFCLDQELVCDGNICYSFSPICSEINHIHTPPFSQICYRSTIGELPISGCENCVVKTTGVRIYRKYNNTGPYATISLSNAEINSFMNLLNGTGSTFEIVGQLNDCEGNIQPTRIQFGTNLPNGPLYCIIL